MVPFLAITFTPSQDEAQYRDGLKLNEKLFADTEANALRWWPRHQKGYWPEESATRIAELPDTKGKGQYDLTTL